MLARQQVSTRLASLELAPNKEIHNQHKHNINDIELDYTEMR